LIWNEDGTYKSRRQLQDIVEGAVGAFCRDTEVIVYCGVGGYGSAWLFVLTAVLGYTNVKLYDGSAQEWVRYYDMVM
jgi:thiosulfate/3-mercaptopyruvate sulfurtransferase